MPYKKFVLFFGVILVSFNGGCTTGCEPGWVHFQASCYLFKDETENWASAGSICTALQGKLVEIESSVENKFLKNRISHLHPNHTFDNVNYWTGGNDLEREGSYIWIKSRASFTFTDWHASQPNGGSEDCVAYNCFTDSSIQWHDFACHQLLYYICEKELSDDELMNIIG
ncbi:perlucin-like protein [Saccostrea echinata]|uniref:perlucin-like protein n=1 Tax=Saccostrea echinata TaxID=191078 RepID=UPI002A8037F1|nr:perlucin-like protein [Saccostrea echinata]